MYKVKADEVAGVLHLTLWGFWSLETAHAFAADLLTAIARMREQRGRYAILSDSSRFPVQSAEVSAVFGRIMAESGGGARTAIVVASTLNKLQAQRAMPSPRIGVFLTRAEALAWLAAPPT